MWEELAGLARKEIEMQREELDKVFRSMWTKDLNEILGLIESGQRPISFSGVITDNRDENNARAEMIREIIRGRCSSVLTARTA